MSEKTPFEYEIDKNFDYTIDEKGNTFLALRKIKWSKNSDEYKLDLRKYYSRPNGEMMSKGVSFLTDDGPSELINVLLKEGYGRPKEIADIIQNQRHDIMSGLIEPLIYATNNMSEEERKSLFESYKEENTDGTYYDPREMII